MSKLLTYILRHHPEKFDLELDKNGWIDIDILIDAINKQKENSITKEEIFDIVKKCNKQRFSIENNKIRCVQGHSIEIDLELTQKQPPPMLFHGTSNNLKEVISVEGLKKMERNHVHMSKNILTAIDVGKRKGNVVVAVIDSLRMFNDGYVFYESENNVWLIDSVPSQYIRFFSVDHKCACGGFIILNKDKSKYLLVKTKSGHWGFPKGKKNRNESIMHCAIRELNEETGLTENDIEIDYNYQMMFELSNKGQESVGLFVAYSNKEEVKINDLDELEEIGWFSKDETLEKLSSEKNRKDLIHGL